MKRVIMVLWAIVYGCVFVYMVRHFAIYPATFGGLFTMIGILTVLIILTIETFNVLQRLEKHSINPVDT